MRHPNNPWKIPGALDRLLDLSAKEYSFSHMALILNSEFRLTLSRCAISGKINRLGLCKPKGGSREIKARVISSRRPCGKPGAPPVKVSTLSVRPQDAPYVAPPVGGISIMQLTDSTCRWPLWAAGCDVHMYCGAQTQPGCGPYCLAHHRRSRVSFAERRQLILELRTKKENSYA